MSVNKPLLFAGGLVGAYFLFKRNAASIQVPGITTATALLPGSTYPFLVAGAPAMPAAYNQAYYLTYIRPAMVAANPNVNNPGYTLSEAEAQTYLANYADVFQWAYNTGPQGGGRHQTPIQAAQYHWHTYGVADQRTFLPLPWNDPARWVPPPSNSNSSGSGSTLSTLTTVASVVAMFVGPDDLLNDTEIDLIVTSAAVIKKILPFYLEVAPELVHSIEFKLDNLLSKYAN